MKTEPFVVNVGPQHPSTHGVFRLRLTLDGERIVDADMVMGYLHRSMEKLAEGRTYIQNIPFTDRIDYLSSMANNLAYCMAVEKLVGIEVPERGQFLRVIMAEFQRLANHAMAIGAFLNDCGAWFTPLMWMFREREKILDLFEMTCGARLTVNYMRIGGVSFDIPPEFMPAARALVKELPQRIAEYEALLLENEILIARHRRPATRPGHRRLGERADAAGERCRLGHPQGRSLRSVRPGGVRHSGGHPRRLLRPLCGTDGGDAPERAHYRAGTGYAAGRPRQREGSPGPAPPSR
jgi:NADH-quinone oxidoreductase subunit D